MDRKPTAQTDRDGEHPLGHLHQNDLARRWHVSPRTLERWRWLKRPPNYIKIGSRVVYRIEDIEAFEAAQLRQGTLPDKDLR
jgi:hypothetical protein